ncbi:MAG: L-asparaginase [Patiriisocius sp.]|jgi:L-asparaginase
MNKRKVLIVYTGGTIGMVRDYSEGSLKPFDFNNLLEHIPELNEFNLELDTAILKEPIDSSNMNPDVWKELLAIISSNYDDVDGFVILHGTDTMAYTASAMSFMIENLSKPIIFTGSQLPIETIRTDGKENIITAIEIASSYYRGKPRVAEVAVYFEYFLHRANRTTKYSSDHFDAFKSPNYPVLAEANIEIAYNKHSMLKVPDKKVTFHNAACGDITVLKMYPGISKEMVKHILSNPTASAVILETYGAGNTITDKWFLDFLKEFIDLGKLIINISQCMQGSVKQGLYETSEKLKEIGVVSAADMTFEASITKLMYLMCRYSSLKTISREFEKNLRGELTISELEFTCLEVDSE